MKRISHWASCHIKAARLLIIAIKIILLLLAYYTGITLYKMQVVLPQVYIYSSCIFLLLIIIAVYPSHKKIKLSKKLLYARQKACDFILPLCSFLVMATMVSNGNVQPGYTGAYGSHSIKKATAAEILASGKTKDALSRKEKRVLKKEFYKQLKVYAGAKMSGDKESSGAAWKIILTIIAAVGLSYLLAALVCNLSCSGSDVFATVVGVLGLAAIIWGVVAIIKRINRGPKNKKGD